MAQITLIGVTKVLSFFAGLSSDKTVPIQSFCEINFPRLAISQGRMLKG